ncbi:ABC transporter substrate-binding protein [uncultured Meiothermus sp.]|jgi:raffinose/stachyose/melibiose transport system substrate-binding protein|uniref:ABC transporter substrate-binding protein n=1 Tax=uncultured Meiothermus sp. TaxID=157471 RepID=UPI00260D08D6|nr:ABC transporter substrate-binding protein [uncultured Meiothermus sp.]
MKSSLLKAIGFLLVLLIVGTAVAQERVTLRLAAIVNDQEPVTAVVAEYMRRNPHITITTTFAPIDQYQVVLRTQLAAGTAPDILFVWAGAAGNPMSVGLLAENNLLADLSNEPWVRDIPAGVRSSVQHGGRTFIYPVNKLVIGLFYNRQILQNHGLGVPRTWNDLLAACERLSRAGITPLAQANQVLWVTQLIPHAITASTVYATDPDFDIRLAQGRATFAGSAGYRDALQRYLELNRRGCFNRFPNATSYEDIVRMMATGRAAMAVQTPGFAAQATRQGMAAEHLGMVPFPVHNDGTRPWIFASVLSSFGVSAASRNQAAARDFIRFLAQPEILSIYLGGRIPAVPHPALTVSPLFSEMLAAIREGRSAPVGVFWPNPRVQDVYMRGIQQLFDGSKTIDQLLAELDRIARER